MNGCCTDIVEIPPTQDAPAMGLNTMVTLSVGFSGNETACVASIGAAAEEVRSGLGS